MNLNLFLPTTFFLVLLSFSKQLTLPFLLFAGLFLDFIVYDFPFYHTILLLVMYIIAFFSKSKDTLGSHMLMTFFYTSLYYLFWGCFYHHNLLIYFFFALVWNLCLTIILWRRGPITIHKGL